MAAKRKRSADFTALETETVIRLFVQHHVVLTSRHSATITQKDKQMILHDICEQVNAVGTCERSIDSIKDKWNTVKKSVKAKAVAFFAEKKKKQTVTGGGSGEDDEEEPYLTELELMVYRILPKEQVAGIPGGFASNEPSCRSITTSPSPSIPDPDRALSAAPSPASLESDMPSVQMPRTTPPLCMSERTRQCTSTKKKVMQGQVSVSKPSEESKMTSDMYYKEMVHIEQEKLEIMKKRLDLKEKEYQLKEKYYSEKLKLMRAQTRGEAVRGDIQRTMSYAHPTSVLPERDLPEYTSPWAGRPLSSYMNL